MTRLCIYVTLMILSFPLCRRRLYAALRREIFAQENTKFDVGYTHSGPHWFCKKRRSFYERTLRELRSTQSAAAVFCSPFAFRNYRSYTSSRSFFSFVNSWLLLLLLLLLSSLSSMRVQYIHSVKVDSLLRRFAVILRGMLYRRGYKVPR